MFAKCFLALLNNQFVLIRNSPKTQHRYQQKVPFGVENVKQILDYKLWFLKPWMSKKATLYLQNFIHFLVNPRTQHCYQ